MMSQCGLQDMMGCSIAQLALKCVANCISPIKADINIIATQRIHDVISTRANNNYNQLHSPLLLQKFLRGLRDYFDFLLICHSERSATVYRYVGRYGECVDLNGSGGYAE
jgi:hypothetical protein